MSREVGIGSVTVGGKAPLALIAGPCVIESEELAISVARELRTIAQRAGIPLIYKSSYDKANRSSVSSYRGPGLREGLRILKKVKDEVGLPVLSDVHQCEEVDSAAEVLDAIQIPAFLCRQTDLVLAAARSGRAVNVKKGQFLSPQEVRNIVEKVESVGCRQLTITERGTTFGYQNLVVDFCALAAMREFGYPLVFDATHSVQLPGGGGRSSGGRREFVAPLARAAVAVGCEAIFMEVHPSPEEAPSDGPNMVPLAAVPSLIRQLQGLDRARRDACIEP